MFGTVVVEPRDDKADLGVFFMDSDGYLDMCGHGTIGVVSALIELGHLPAEPTIHVETPAGIVEARPQYTEGGIERVTIQNVESQQSPSRSPNRRFEWTSSTPEISLRWSIVSNLESQLTLPVLTTSSIGDLEIRDAVNETLEIVHPITGEPSEVSITEIYESSDNADHSIVVFGDGQVDRSPCGTGTCAKMALLHDAGQLAVERTVRPRECRRNSIRGPNHRNEAAGRRYFDTPHDNRVRPDYR